jgi:signal transduction histidine kinase/CheY-like chemotaxis protein
MGDDISVKSHRFIVKCLKSLLNNHPVNVVLEAFLKEVCSITGSRYGMIGEKKTDYIRYYGIQGMSHDSPDYVNFIKEGYLDDTAHHMYVNFKDTEPVYLNDIKRNRGRKFPHGHPDINKVIFIPLKDVKENIIGVLVLSGDYSYNKEFVVKYEQLIELSSVFLQITLERVILIKSRDNFLANISHELRTPLSGIISINNILLSMDLTPKLKHHMEIIQACCTQLLDLTNDILDYTNISSGNIILKKEHINLNDIINKVISMVDDKIMPGVKISKIVDPNIPETLIGDNTRITQILINLVDNSCKFTKEGTITIETKYVEKKDHYHTINIKVKDTGIGIKDEIKKNIFDMVNSFNPSYLSSQNGVGLGLPITKYLIELYNGKISLNSLVDQGTEVSFNLDLGMVNNYQNLKKKIINKDILLYIKNNDQLRRIIFDFLLDMESRPLNATDKKMYKRFIKSHGGSFKFNMIITDQKDIEFDNIKVVYVDNTDIDIDLLVTKMYNGKTESNSQDTTAIVIDKHIRSIREKYKILIAEDNKQNMEVFIMLLETMGYLKENMVCVSNGAELYVKLMDKDTQFDIVFVDLKMPVMDGITAIKQYNSFVIKNPQDIISQKRKKMLILAVTASVSADTRQKCLDSGMNGYIQKPIKIKDIEQIDIMVRSLLL